MVINKRINFTFDTKFESLNDFLENLSYVAKEEIYFKAEINFIYEVIITSIKNDKAEEIKTFLQELGRIKNKFFIEQLYLNVFIGLLYEFKGDTKKKETLAKLFGEYFYSINYYNSIRLFDKIFKFSSTAISSEINNFESTKKTEEVENLNKYIQGTMATQYNLCRELINMDFGKEEKYKFLQESLYSFNHLLDSFMFSSEEDFEKEYYHLKWKKDLVELDRQKINLAEKKIEVVRNLNDSLSNYKIELMYLILFFIDRGQLDRDFFKLAKTLYFSGEIKRSKEFYQYNRFDNLSFLNYDSFKGSGQSLPEFNQNRYRLILMFYDFCYNDTNISLSDYKESNFASYATPSFEDNLAKLSFEEIGGFFDSNLKKFKQFKKKMHLELKNRCVSIKKEEVTRLIEAPLDRKKVSEFKQEILQEWERNQLLLDGIFTIIVKKQDKFESLFGINTWYPKEPFIDSFDKNVSYMSNASDLARDLAFGKKNKLFLEIEETFSIERGDLTKETENLINTLRETLKKESGEFILLCDENLYKDIYINKEVSFDSIKGERASINFGSTRIYLYYAPDLKASYLFKKGSFIVNQYQKPQEEAKQEEVLFVEVKSYDKNKDKTAINKIIDSNKNIKTEEDVLTKVAIRIVEKFEFERNPESKLYKLKKAHTN